MLTVKQLLALAPLVVFKGLLVVLVSGRIFCPVSPRLTLSQLVSQALLVVSRALPAVSKAPLVEVEAFLLEVTAGGNRLGMSPIQSA